MTDQPKQTRPSQVTMAGWVAAVASGLTVLMLFDSVSRLQTVQFRDGIEELLSTPPYNGLGVELAQVLDLIHGAMLVAGAAAAAALVFAIFVLRRHNAARIGFTVAAVVLVLTAPFTGGFLPILIAVAATWLWSRPARDWFAGRPVSERGEGSEGRSRAFATRPQQSRAEGNIVSSENHPPHEQPGGPGPDDGPSAGDASAAAGGQEWPRMPDDSSDRPLPPPSRGFAQPGSAQPGSAQPGSAQPGSAQPGPYGQPPQGPPPYGRPLQGPPQYGQPGPYGQQSPYGYPQYGQQPPYGYPQYGQQPPYGYPQPHAGQYYGGQPPRDADKRPATVTAAAWTTWVLAGLTVFGLLAGVIGLVGGRDQILREIEQTPDLAQFDYTPDQVISMIWVMLAIFLFWALASMVLAWFAFRGAGWARITLVVSAGVTAFLSLIMAFGVPFLLLMTLGAGTVMVLLFVGGANEWYARRSGSQGYPGGFQPYRPPGGQQYGGPPGQPGQQRYGGHEPREAPRYGDQQAGPPEEPAKGPGMGPDKGHGKDEPPSNVW